MWQNSRTIYVLGYGALRTGTGFHQQLRTKFGNDAIKYHGRITVPGIKIYSTGSKDGFAGIRSMSDKDCSVECDMLEMVLPAYHFVRQAALDAGHHEDMCLVMDHAAIIFLRTKILNTWKRVESEHLNHLTH